MTLPTSISSLPLTPMPGTADPRPLVTVQQYQKFTADYASSVNDVEEAIADAVVDLSQECKRTWLYAQYTEDQYLYSDGKVYPSATPIDASKPITNNGLSIFDPTAEQAPGSTIQGDGVWIGYFSPLTQMPVFMGNIPPQTTITYWGGFTQDTLPKRPRQMFMTTAFYALNPSRLPAMPGGVKAMSVGGVSISGSLSSFMTADPQLRSLIRRWRHPMVHAWQS